MTTLPARRRRIDFVALSTLALIVLCVAAWVSVLRADSATADAIFSGRTWHELTRFLRELLGIIPGWDVRRPAFLDAGRWGEMAALAYQTLAMSVLATGIAALGALLTAMPAARAISSGDRTHGRGPIGRLLAPVIRALLVVSRSIPELLWALLIIFVLSPGILPGALALSLHNFGILGKLYAEVIENLDRRPSRALRTAGARSEQVLCYAVLPQALPGLITYTLYRWEVIIRTTIVVGFVGAGGLGQAFRLAMSFFRYTEITQILITYLLLALAVDAASATLRRLAR